jgi:hypothetical protein
LEEPLARIVDARNERKEIMVEDAKGNIFNADVVSRYQTLASGKDDSEKTEMLVQSITMEDGRSLSLQKDGTYRAIVGGEVFRLVEDPQDEV